MFKKVFFLICSVVLLSACTARITDFTLISSKNVDLSKASTFERGKVRVVGEDKMHIILVFPTKFNITVKQALDNAIQSVPGCVALVDGVINQTNFYFFLYGQSSFLVEGTPLIDPKLAAEFENSSSYRIAYLDNNGNLYKSENLTKEEFEKMSK